MKIFAPLLTVFLSAIVAATALTVEDLQVSYQAALLKANETRDRQVATLDQRYLEALTKIREEQQKKGDLDGALAIKNEADLVEKKTWPLPPLPGVIETTLGGHRTTYLKARIGIERDWALTTSGLADKMEAALATQIENLTKSGDLAEAQKARKILEAISLDPEVIRARELPERLTSSGRARAGFVVRRNGDDLEVLVRYDSEGKISLKSPVENVVERTGGKRNKGETAAKTLGEFVGAEGFESQPYLSLRHTLEDGEIDFSDQVGVQLKFLPKEGTEIAISPTANNAYLAVPGVLSPSPATYRITSEVMVPSGNRALRGLFFRHGGSTGTPIGKPVTGNGEWQSVTCEGPGGSQADFLRIHFTGFALKDYPQARGDRLILKSLQVEYLRFSAHIVEAFGKSGETTDLQTEARHQKLLLQNGVMLPR